MLAPVGVHSQLSWAGFGLSSPDTSSTSFSGVEVHSGKNYASAPVLKDFFPPALTTSYEGSEIVFFDLEKFWWGCSVKDMNVHIAPRQLPGWLVAFFGLSTTTFINVSVLGVLLKSSVTRLGRSCPPHTPYPSTSLATTQLQWEWWKQISLDHLKPYQESSSRLMVSSSQSCSIWTTSDTLCTMSRIWKEVLGLSCIKKLAVVRKASKRR